MIPPAALIPEVPVIGTGKMSAMTVQEEELGAALMKVRVNVVGSSDRRQTTIVEQPDGLSRRG